MVAAVTLLFAFAALLAAYYKRLSLLPEYDMLSTKAEMLIHDETGTKATFSRRVRFRPNYRHLREMTFGNIRGNGPTTNYRWDGSVIPDKSIMEGDFGERKVTVLLRPMEQWREYSGTLSYEYNDSFTGNPEFVTYQVERPTREASIQVQLPAARPCKKAWATRFVVGGQEDPYKSPTVSDDKRKVELQIDKPVLGRYYKLWWEW